jgi:DNA helicase-2/ATP-dependent DNA helicase PcrA
MQEAYLNGLNEKQLEAVLHIKGPLMIIAGAGSGKTRVLVNRIAWLIEQGSLNLSQVMAVTFTNKAASEMKQRLKNERLNNRSNYLQTIKNLILQSMIKLLEPSLKVMVRKEDLNDIQSCINDL